jgi:hypothetical protein
MVVPSWVSKVPWKPMPKNNHSPLGKEKGFDAPPNSLKHSNVSSKVKITEEGVGVHSVTCSISR